MDCERVLRVGTYAPTRDPRNKNENSTFCLDNHTDTNMAEDFAAQLDGYRLQLQQVEAAMLAEPDNNELTKLEKDLQEVIALTRELAQGSSGDNGGSSAQIDWKVCSQNSFIHCMLAGW
jgi:hypothetical protein